MSKKPTPAKKATQPAAGKAAPARRKVDWEAVERDYRATQMTLRELGEKHGCDHAAIARKAKRDGWERDLAPAVRQATNARLIEAAVNEAVTSSQQEVTNVVLAVAEVNTRVILGHRQDIAATRNVAAALLVELSNAALLAEHQELLAEILAGEEAEPADIARARATVNRALSINGRIASVKQLADTFDKLQLAERRAFGIPTDGTGEAPGTDKPQKRVVLEFVDVEPK